VWGSTHPCHALLKLELPFCVPHAATADAPHRLNEGVFYSVSCQIKDAFDFFDTDGSGEIDRHEMHEAMKAPPARHHCHLSPSAPHVSFLWLGVGFQVHTDGRRKSHQTVSLESPRLLRDSVASFSVKCVARERSLSDACAPGLILTATVKLTLRNLKS
jgi:hypothetical protein